VFLEHLARIEKGGSTSTRTATGSLNFFPAYRGSANCGEANSVASVLRDVAVGLLKRGGHALHHLGRRIVGEEIHCELARDEARVEG